MRMKMAVEAAGGVAPSTKDKEEPAETARVACLAVMIGGGLVYLVEA